LGCGSPRFISSEDESRFKEAGYLDDHGVTKFDTLYEMQTTACKVFSGNELFGTYKEHSNKFEFMTYEQYDEKVAACRKVLVDLGKKSCYG
jgi:hypothetical protein